MPVEELRAVVDYCFAQINIAVATGMVLGASRVQTEDGTAWRRAPAATPAPGGPPD